MKEVFVVVVHKQFPTDEVVFESEYPTYPFEDQIEQTLKDANVFAPASTLYANVEKRFMLV